MKKNLLFFMGLAFLTIACSENKKFDIALNLANAGNEMVYLKKASDLENVTLDSVVLVDGKAVFTTPVVDDNEMYSVMVKSWRRPISFFPDGKKTVIDADNNKLSEAVITASETQARLNDFTKGFNELDAQLDALSHQIAEAKNDTALVEKLKRKYADMEEAQKMYCFDYIWENKSDVVAHYVLYRYKWAFEPCEIHYMIDNLDTLVNSSNLELAKAYVAKLDRVSVGQPLIDFTQNAADGTSVTLSELAANTPLLLVDFWASWCPDCRKENPNVVAAYKKYHDQGFDVLSVSYDTKKEAWLAGIEKDGLTWTQVSDLKGWGNATADLYAVSFIPQNVLIKNGMIVAKNLSGEDLQKEIELQLNK
jgi:Peroxiredoxin